MKTVLFFFISLMTSIGAMGAEVSLLKEKHIQSIIHELCSYDDKIIFAGHFYNKAAESVRHGVEITLNTASFQHTTSRKDTGVHTEYMYDFVNSDAFFNEMRTCIPDEDRRNQMVFLALFADIAGQFTGASQVGISFWGMGKLAGLIGRGLYNSFSFVLTKLKPTATIAITKEAFSRYFQWALFILPTMYQVGDKLMENKNPQIIDVEAVKKQLTKTELQINLLLEKRSKLQTMEPGYCVLNDYAFNLAQKYFSTLREMKDNDVDLKVFGDTRDFRMKIREIKLCRSEGSH